MKRFYYHILLTICVLLYQNCSPFETNTSFSENSSLGTTVFSLNCLPDDPRMPLASELKPLNSFELENTLIDLFEPYLSASQIDQFRNRMRPLINEIPKNEVDVGMDIANHGVTLIHVEKHFLLAEVVADFITGNQSILNNVLGACASTSGTESCQKQFLSRFGLRALRRPLDNDALTFYQQVMSGHGNSYRNAIASLLSSPLFYYHGEFGQHETSQKMVELDIFERASRLSYFLLQSMPDDELLSAAADGSLLTTEGLRQQVDRLLKHPKVRQRLTRFFANQWLHMDKMVEPQTEVQKVQTLISELADPPPFNTLRGELQQEVYDFFDYLIWEQRADYQQLMTSNLVFPRNQILAKIYGTAEWNGSYELSSLVRAPANERSGPLTRAQFLYTSSGNTRPIMRGVKVYRDFMCQDLNLPPDNSTPEGVELKNEMTDREVVIATTEVPGTSCVGCHQKLINPLGFAFDQFDALGRFRTQERIFHPEGTPQQGQVLISKNVQPTDEISILPYIDGEIKGAIGLVHELAKNPDALACFSSKLWNFSQKSNLEVEANPCAVQNIFGAIGNQGSIIDGIRQIVLQPEFMRRTLK